MFANLKRILLTQYIGAILTAFVGSQAVASLVGTVILPLQWTFLAPRGSALGMAKASYDGFEIALGLIKAALYAAIAFALVKWLYWPGEAEHRAEAVAEPAPEVE